MYSTNGQKLIASPSLKCSSTYETRLLCIHVACRYIGESFTIKHFADVVMYTVGTFVTKNNDTVPGDLLELMHQSTNPCLLSCFENAVGDGQDSKGRNRFQTVTAQFGTQMFELRHTLESTAGEKPKPARLAPNEVNLYPYSPPMKR